MEIIYIFISGLAVMLVSLGGIIFTTKKMGSWLDRNLPLLVSFSAGVFLVVSYQLISEVFEHSENWLWTFSTIIIGVLGTALINKILPETHHHESSEHCEHHVSSKRILFGDALHNITDGFILVPAYLLSLQTGIILTIGIIIHETIQEISEFFVLKKAGLSNKSALTKNFIVSSTILFGIALGLLLNNTHEIESVILGLAAGSFLYIFIVDLLPNVKKAIWIALLGAFIFSGIGQLVGEHGHGDEDQENSENSASELISDPQE